MLLEDLEVHLQHCTLCSVEQRPFDQQLTSSHISTEETEALGREALSGC
ncbi:MAG: hypothetical protein K2P90_04145 [Holosporales bacterium]|nr:hypothetical protein [Holosporales bacterium]